VNAPEIPAPVFSAPVRARARDERKGRPSSYTPAKADWLCCRLAYGESLRAICREPGMPSVRTVLTWATTRPDFRKQYDQAREMGRQAICDEVLELADNVWRRNSPTALQDARREIDAKKWHLARMTPKRRRRN
jgi:hypothetical protein